MIALGVYLAGWLVTSVLFTRWAWRDSGTRELAEALHVSSPRPGFWDAALGASAGLLWPLVLVTLGVMRLASVGTSEKP